MEMDRQCHSFRRTAYFSFCFSESDVRLRPLRGARSASALRLDRSKDSSLLINSRRVLESGDAQLTCNEHRATDGGRAGVKMANAACVTPLWPAGCLSHELSMPRRLSGAHGRLLSSLEVDGGDPQSREQVGGSGGLTSGWPP